MISIHALVKRATTAFQLVERYQSISIHALVKRATRNKQYAENTVYISIHALVKRATDYMAICAFNVNISIHALVKRATLLKRIVIRWRNHFNPRPREEGDNRTITAIAILSKFQSTPS